MSDMKENSFQNDLDFGLNKNGEYEHINNDVVVLPPESDTSKYAVVKSNRLITAQNRLNLNEQKVLAACISLINPQSNYPNGITVELSDADISILTGIEKRTIGRFAKKAAYNIQTIPVRPMDVRSGDTAYVNISKRSEWFPKEKIFRITFHEDMEEELLDVVRYTKYMLGSIKGMRRKHSLSIFELCCKMYNRQKGGSQVYKMKIQDLHYFLAIVGEDDEVLSPSYYEDFYALRRSVLQPSFDDINSNANVDLKVSFTEYKSGKNVSGIHISISERPKIVVSSDSDSHTTESTELIAALLEIGINDELANRWINKFGVSVVRSNLDYLKNRKDIGSNINNPIAYLNKLLMNNVAQIPSVANPYAEANNKNSTLREFLSRIVVPIWWKMPRGAAEDIQERGHILNYPPFKGLYVVFESYIDSMGLEDATALCSDQEELIIEIRKEMRNNS